MCNMYCFSTVTTVARTHFTVSFICTLPVLLYLYRFTKIYRLFQKLLVRDRLVALKDVKLLKEETLPILNIVAS
jgi:hypothetical protein